MASSEPVLELEVLGDAGPMLDQKAVETCCGIALGPTSGVP